MKPEDFRSDKKRPFTSQEYLASLVDGREVYFRGEKINDVTTHPATRNSARSVARLYDALHDPEHKKILCREREDAQGYTHKAFRLAVSPQELKEQRDAMALWARLSYGQLTRSPDYKAAFSCSLGVDPDFFGEYADNARAWYQRIQENCLYMNHALINPPIISDAFIKIDKETDEGIFVSGAKAVATNAALTHYIFVGQIASSADDITPETATSFIAPLNAKGLKVILRQSYEYLAQAMGPSDDYPLSSRFDENDAILIFDNVFIPWENVLIFKDEERTKAWFDQGFGRLFPFQSCTRMAVKMNFLTGLLSKALESTGSLKHRGVRVKLGEVIAYRNLFWSLTDAMWSNPENWKNGALLPNSQAVHSFRVFAPEAHRAVKGLIEETVASGLIFLPSGISDTKNSELDKYLARYLKGPKGNDHLERIKLFKLLWELVGTEFAGRQELYEINNAGGPEATRLQCLRNAQRTGDFTGDQEFGMKFFQEFSS